MKYILIIGLFLFALLCVSISGYLIINEKDGWGWFLFVGILSIGGISYNEKN